MTAVLEKLREFDRVAGMLEMPVAERLGILNVTEDVYAGLRASNPASLSSVQPELERRLTYALPLMRRLAGNLSVVRLPIQYKAA